MKNILLVLILLSFGCETIRTGDVTDSPITLGDGNFVYYAPDKSRTYKKEEITKAIDIHKTTIQIINKRINYYEHIKSTITDKYNEGNLPKKKYKKQKEDVDIKLNDLKYDRNEADKAFDMWKGLLTKHKKEESEYQKKLAELKSREQQLEAEKQQLEREKKQLERDKNTQARTVSAEWRKIDQARKQLDNDIKEFEEASRYKPTNCHRITFDRGGYLVFRSKPLTREEINALNSCASWSTLGGGTAYEDLSRRDCQIKKRLDEESSIGLFQNGDIVDYIGKQGSWNEIVNIETGQRGFISAKYAGKPTLVKTSCN